MSATRRADMILCRDLAVKASVAIAALCDLEGTRFWRSTVHRRNVTRQEDGRNARFPTVSLCCSQALLALNLAEPNWIQDGVSAVIPTALQIPRELEWSDLAGSSLTTGLEPSPFTLALHLQALALLSKSGVGRDRLAEMVEEISGHPSQPFAQRESGPRAHPFVMYHIVRAIEEAATVQGSISGQLRIQAAATYELLESEAVKLLAYHHVGKVSPAQVVALAFCGAGLAFEPSGAYDAYAAASLGAACAGQEKSGCWALGRVLREDKDLEPDAIEIEISTYEIAWAISDAVLLMLPRAADTRLGDSLDSIVNRLILSAQYADTSIVTLAETTQSPRTGWCSDHAYNQPMIESWTSATVLRAALSLGRLLRSVDSYRVIEQYAPSYPSDAYWPRWLRWDSFRVAGEVDDRAKVLTYLDDHLIRPIRESPFCLPSGQENTVSALLFGPPGTAKTTVARAVAEGLGWPIVELNPGVFIERGLELIEARAHEVFEDLHRLERVVVLFDECDELFRARGPSEESEQIRSITAFVTASMLPKLQRLHDDGRVVFFICTNNFAHLDPAIRRRGRIDHIVAIGPPDEGARRRLVLSELKGVMEEQPTPQLWTDTEMFTRSELVHLIRQLRREIEAPGTAWDAQVEERARQLIATFKQSLNISREIYLQFQGDQRAASHPHLYQGIHR